MKQIVSTLTIVAIVAVISLLEGFVIQHLWGWFIVRQFHLSSLGLAEAIGIGLLCSALGNYTYVKLDRSAALESFVVNLVRPILFLIVGYIVYTFI